MSDENKETKETKSPGLKAVEFEVRIREVDLVRLREELADLNEKSRTVLVKIQGEVETLEILNKEREVLEAYARIRAADEDQGSRKGW